MASVFKQAYTGGKTKTWYAEFRDHHKVRRRLPGYRDKRSTEDLARNVERIAELRRARAPLGDLALWAKGLPRPMRSRLVSWGLVDDDAHDTARPLLEHLEDFRSALAARGNTARHTRQTLAQITRILEGCHVSNWADLEALPVEKFLASVREDRPDERGMGRQTSRYYLASLRAFTKWMVENGRATADPLRTAKPAKDARADVRRARRALSIEEQRLLLVKTAAAPERHGMSGAERAWVYRVVLETGLRSSELRSLLVSSFSLVGDQPSVTLQAAYSKHRREDVLPLRRETARALESFLRGRPRSAPAFSIPHTWRAALMLGEDLAAAEIATVDERGCVVPDEKGRILDFHSLRHSFISTLAESGVAPKVAQALARHSTIQLTLDRYTHIRADDDRRALAMLPTLGESLGSDRTQPEISGDAGGRLVPPALSPPPSEPPREGYGSNHNPHVGGSNPSTATSTRHLELVRASALHWRASERGDDGPGASPAGARSSITMVLPLVGS